MLSGRERSNATLLCESITKANFNNNDFRAIRRKFLGKSKNLTSMIMKQEEKKKEQSFQTSKITLPLHYYCRQSKKDCVLLALNLLELITRVCDKLVK